MKRTILFIMMTSMAAVGIWANGTQETTESVSYNQVELVYTPVKDITVEPTSNILAIFESFGISSDYILQGTYTDAEDNDFLAPAPVTQEVKTKLESIIGENKNGVVDMINNELKSKLQRGGNEAAHMTVGSYYFTAQLDYPE